MVSETLQTERQQTKRSPQQTALHSEVSESPGPLLGGELRALAAILRSGGRGNGPTKAAAVQRLQQTHGNRRTVAILQRAQALPQDGGTVAAPQASSAVTWPHPCWCYSGDIWGWR
ncbi:MAG: hypothetical protein M3Z04_01305 [Chloroflexota bacterium]|nr:hypothetical protein [Chloroflexota bacterium]